MLAGSRRAGLGIYIVHEVSPGMEDTDGGEYFHLRNPDISERISGCPDPFGNFLRRLAWGLKGCCPERGRCLPQARLAGYWYTQYVASSDRKQGSKG